MKKHAIPRAISSSRPAEPSEKQLSLGKNVYFIRYGLGGDPIDLNGGYGWNPRQKEELPSSRQSIQTPSGHFRYTREYPRMDEDMESDVLDRLDELVLEDGSISVEVAEGVVTLRGWVPSADLRETIESVVFAIPGVAEVVNMMERSRPH